MRWLSNSTLKLYFYYTYFVSKNTFTHKNTYLSLGCAILIEKCGSMNLYDLIERLWGRILTFQVRLLIARAGFFTTKEDEGVFPFL